MLASNLPHVDLVMQDEVDGVLDRTHFGTVPSRPFGFVGFGMRALVEIVPVMAQVMMQNPSVRADTRLEGEGDLVESVEHRGMKSIEVLMMVVDRRDEHTEQDERNEAGRGNCVANRGGGGGDCGIERQEMDRETRQHESDGSPIGLVSQDRAFVRWSARISRLSGGVHSGRCSGVVSIDKYPFWSDFWALGSHEKIRRS